MNEKKFDYCFCSWLIFCLALYCIFTRFKIFLFQNKKLKIVSDVDRTSMKKWLRVIRPDVEIANKRSSN